MYSLVSVLNGTLFEYFQSYSFINNSIMFSQPITRLVCKIFFCLVLKLSDKYK